MKILNYEELRNSIKAEDYKDYRISINNHQETYSFSKFMEDMVAVHFNKLPKNMILQNILSKASANTDPTVVLQKAAYHSIEELGDPLLDDCYFVEYEDYALLRLSGEFATLREIIHKVNESFSRIIQTRSFGANDANY